MPHLDLVRQRLHAALVAQRRVLNLAQLLLARRQLVQALHQLALQAADRVAGVLVLLAAHKVNGAGALRQWNE